MPELSPENLKTLIATFLVIILLFIVHRIVVFVVNKRVDGTRLRLVWRQTSRYVLLVLGLVAIINIWFDRFQSVLTLLSLVAAAITIVNKEALLNITGWMVILWRRLFVIGDRISVRGYVGDVIDTGLLYFTIADMSSVNGRNNPSGKIVKINNSCVLTEGITNYTHGFQYIWHELDVVLSLDSDVERAEALLLEVVADYHQVPTRAEINELRDSNQGLVYRTFDANVQVFVIDGALHMHLRYICRPYQTARTEQALWRQIVKRFAAEEGIELQRK